MTVHAQGGARGVNRCRYADGVSTKTGITRSVFFW